MTKRLQFYKEFLSFSKDDISHDIEEDLSIDDLNIIPSWNFNRLTNMIPEMFED